MKIRINEAKLNSIVKEAVRQVIKEINLDRQSLGDWYFGGVKSAVGARRANKMANQQSDSETQNANNTFNIISNMYKCLNSTVNSVGQERVNFSKQLVNYFNELVDDANARYNLNMKKMDANSTFLYEGAGIDTFRSYKKNDRNAINVSYEGSANSRIADACNDLYIVLNKYVKGLKGGNLNNNSIIIQFLSKMQQDINIIYNSSKNSLSSD